MNLDFPIASNSNVDATVQKSRLMRVLLVEDNADDREQITDLIHQTCDSVSTDAVATGEQAIALVQSNDMDCIILDYRLETEDGLDVMRRIKERCPFCPVIILTGQGNEALAATSIKSGAADYLVKNDMSTEHLKKTIDNAISRAALEQKVVEQEQEREQFLRTLVHDLRAPLRLINLLGTAALAETDSGNLDDAKELVQLQSTTAKRATALINTLEAYTLLDGKVEFTSVSLSDVAHHAYNNLITEITAREAQVTISALPSIIGNEAQLIQLFQNLLQNGLKYNTSKPPTIAIRAQNDHAQMVGITITDNGIGIEKKSQKKIFAPLKRLHATSEYEGTGLGLSICQKIVRRHEGKIWCTSTLNKGSTFHLTFPAVSGC